MSDNKKLEEHINGLSQSELIELIKKTAQNLHNNDKRLQNAVAKEGENVAMSRAKSTTLYANTAKLRNSQIGLIDMMKLMITKLV